MTSEVVMAATTLTDMASEENGKERQYVKVPL